MACGPGRSTSARRSPTFISPRWIPRCPSKRRRSCSPPLPTTGSGTLLGQRGPLLPSGQGPCLHQLFGQRHRRVLLYRAAVRPRRSGPARPQRLAQAAPARAAHRRAGGPLRAGAQLLLPRRRGQHPHGLPRPPVRRDHRRPALRSQPPLLPHEGHLAGRPPLLLLRKQPALRVGAGRRGPAQSPARGTCTRGSGLRLRPAKPAGNQPRAWERRALRPQQGAACARKQPPRLAEKVRPRP